MYFVGLGLFWFFFLIPVRAVPLVFLVMNFFFKMSLSDFQISLEELRRATSGPISGEFNSSITGSTTSQSAGSHYDRQLERISQMLKASNDELRNTEKSKTPHHRSIFGGLGFKI